MIVRGLISVPLRHGAWGSSLEWDAEARLALLPRASFWQELVSHVLPSPLPASGQPRGLKSSKAREDITFQPIHIDFTTLKLTLLWWITSHKCFLIIILLGLQLEQPGLNT